MIGLLDHPLVRTSRRYARNALVACVIACALAVALVVTLDIGPTLRGLAEQQGSNFMKRPMHIGQLSIRLWQGRFALSDFVIEGLTSESRPFLTAKRIEIAMPWRTLFDRRVVFDSIEMTIARYATTRSWPSRDSASEWNLDASVERSTYRSPRKSSIRWPLSSPGVNIGDRWRRSPIRTSS